MRHLERRKLLQVFFAGRVEGDPAVDQVGEGEDQGVDIAGLVLCAIPAGGVPHDAALGRCRRGAAPNNELAGGKQQG
jgi:hypothetical protein